MSYLIAAMLLWIIILLTTICRIIEQRLPKRRVED
jgi:hypothetical protein